MKRLSLMKTLITVLLLSWSFLANAAFIKIGISGTAEDDLPLFGLNTGDAFSWEAIVEDTTPISSSSLGTEYLLSSLTFNGIEVTSFFDRLVIQNDIVTSSASFDLFYFIEIGRSLDLFDNGFFVGVPINVLDDESLGGLSKVEGAQFLPVGTGFLQDDDFFPLSTISLSITEVPAPPALAIFAIGLVALCSLKSRQDKGVVTH